MRILSVLVLLLAACSSAANELNTRQIQEPPAQRAETPAGLTAARVVRVVDGDTIDVHIDGVQHRVRYIGMDTPETKHPTRGVEPYGYEAQYANQQFVDGQTVYLEKDVSETDQYGRLLRYAWTEDGVMVNALLVAEGYAQVATYPPDVRYVEEFLALERRAREDGRGLWGLDPDTTNTVVGADCDPSYPDVCIPSPPPDLNCADVSFRRFTVLSGDPHHFDGNGNGVGCERR